MQVQYTSITFKCANKIVQFYQQLYIYAMEKNVLCYSAAQNKYQSVFRKLVTDEWMNRTGFKPVEKPNENPLFCEEQKIGEAPKNKGGRPRKLEEKPI